jgi:ABC-type multidrug transport system ATPase subunit
MMLRSLNERGRTIVMVTHEPTIGHSTKRIIQIRDGKIEFDRLNGRVDLSDEQREEYSRLGDHEEVEEQPEQLEQPEQKQKSKKRQAAEVVPADQAMEHAEPEKKIVKKRRSK